jgi:hypothetical protein
MTNKKSFGLGILLAFSCVLAMAAVNGVFANITASGWVSSVTGYRLNGTAGSSGQALCSDGTNFNTPCSIYNQTVDANGTAQTQRPAFNLISGTNLTTSCVDNGGSNRTDCTFTNTFALPSVGTAGTYTWPQSLTTDTQGRTTAVTGTPFTGTSGYQIGTGGLILQWGKDLNSVANTTNTQSLNFTFPNACLTIVGSTDEATGTGGGASFFNCTTTNFNYYTSNNVLVNWFAIGY